MDTKLRSFIEALEKEIREQTFGLSQYIGESDWNRANNQQWYLAGLQRALQLAKTEDLKEGK